MSAQADPACVNGVDRSAVPRLAMSRTKDAAAENALQGNRLKGIGKSRGLIDHRLGQGETEGGALVVSSGFDPDAAAIHLYDPLDDGQADAGAGAVDY